MMKLLFSLITGLFLYGCSQNQSIDDQNFEIFPAQGKYIVRGSIDFIEKYSSADASESIQWAIDQFKGEGLVSLKKGRYLLHSEVHLKSDVSIEGVGNSTKLILAADHESGNGIIMRSIDNANVGKLLIRSIKDQNISKTGIIIDNSGNCKVDGVTIVGMNNEGVVLRNNTFLSTVINSFFAACEESAIKLENLSIGGRGGDFVTNNIDNNQIIQGGYGVYCSNAIVANIRDVSTYQTKKPAFYIVKGSNSILVSGCRTYQTQSDAIVVENSHEINISSSIFCWSEGNGLVLTGVKWGTIAGNNFIDNGSINPFERDRDSLIVQGKRDFRRMPRTPDDRKAIKSGIVINAETKGVTVTGNALFNWPAAPKMEYGIIEDSSCENNVISSNNINTYQKAAVLSNGIGSSAFGNVGYGDQPYTGAIGITKLQYFDLRLMERFIDEMWN